MPRGIFCLALLLALVSACTRPPPDAYVQGGPATAAVPAGRNAAGEACTRQDTGAQANGAGSSDIYCGAWQEPSATLRRQAQAQTQDDGDIAALAQASPWRTGLDGRFTCGAPSPATLLGDQPAVVLACTRKQGGWPQVALVTRVNGVTWFADGVPAALPVMERSIGVLSGRLPADAASSQATPDADALLATRLAARAFSSGDIGQYQQLIQAGSRANLGQDFAAAEQAFRAALAVQQKALGADDPNLATPLTFLALQLSNQGRFAEADAAFARAAALAPHAADPVAMARLWHDRGLNLLNERKPQAALEDFTRADATYAALLPPETLAARPRVRLAQAGQAAGLLPDQEAPATPMAQSALLGLIEVRRYESIALRQLGRAEESEAAVRAAQALAAGNRVESPYVVAHLLRTAGATAGVRGETSAAIADLQQSAGAFEQVLPVSRPLAETWLLSAVELRRAGRAEEALARCRAATRLLQEAKAGTSAALIDPCLSIYAAAAGAQADQKQALLREMFAASQLAQGGVTSRQIALAAARLSAGSSDPKVAEAIRARQDAGSALADLYRERDAAAAARAAQGQGGAPAAGLPDAAALDRRIQDAQAAVAEADAALQSAAPNYGQLVQEVAPAADVLAALAPGEAFAAITLGQEGGWTFLLRDGQVQVARVPLGTAGMAALVARVRAGIEPGADGAVPRFDVAAAREIYTGLFGALETPLEGAHALVVAPAGPLLSLPFAVLLSGPADAGQLAAAPWLLRRFAITHVPAAANFVSLRRVAGTARGGRPWFGFGEFRPATLAQAQRLYPAGCGDSARLFAGLPPLPGASLELDASRALLGGTAHDELLGAAFTAAAVQRASLQPYRVLHFATHALLPTDLACQSEPAIVTSVPVGAASAQGALLTASDITGMKLDADAVILSACNSGGPAGGAAGESLSGLARAFFYAGARALVVTHWSVNDRTAAFLVADTLRRLGGGQAGLADSLRAAELSLIDGAGHDLPAEVAHPFYWAPFAVIGDGGGRTRTAEAAVPAGRAL